MTLDEQIKKLQTEKANIEKIKKDKTNEELIKFASTLEGKYFKQYNGTNGCGYSSFQYFAPTKFEKIEYSGKLEYMLFGHGILVNLTFPTIYKGTGFDHLVIYEGHSFGTNKWKK